MAGEVTAAASVTPPAAARRLPAAVRGTSGAIRATPPGGGETDVVVARSLELCAAQPGDEKGTGGRVPEDRPFATPWRAAVTAASTAVAGTAVEAAVAKIGAADPAGGFLRVSGRRPGAFPFNKGVLVVSTVISVVVWLTAVKA